MTDLEPCVLSERRGPLVFITLNRPGRRNRIAA
jgi:hypothetical protein